jgi:hypothetical protein
LPCWLFLIQLRRPKTRAGNQFGSPSQLSLRLRPGSVRGTLPAVRTARAVQSFDQRMHVRWSHSSSRQHTICIRHSMKTCKSPLVLVPRCGCSQPALIQRGTTRLVTWPIPQSGTPALRGKLKGTVVLATPSDASFSEVLSSFYCALLLAKGAF